jgi:hypothetical protein
MLNEVVEAVNVDALQREEERLQLCSSGHSRRGERRWREQVNLEGSPQVIAIQEKGAVRTSAVDEVWVREMHVDASMVENGDLAEGERMSIEGRP